MFQNKADCRSTALGMADKIERAETFFVEYARNKLRLPVV